MRNDKFVWVSEWCYGVMALWVFVYSFVILYIAMSLTTTLGQHFLADIGWHWSDDINVTNYFLTCYRGSMTCYCSPVVFSWMGQDREAVQ